MVERNAKMAAERRIEFRVGIDVGDIIVDGGDIFGDGVNVAARLEALCEPGGLCISRVARDHIRDKLAFPFVDLGEQKVKNIGRAIRAFGLTAEAVAAGPGETLPRSMISAEPMQIETKLGLPDKPSIAVLPFQNIGAATLAAGVFRRRNGRGDHHGAQPYPLAIRDRPQFELHLQGSLC